MFLFYERYDRLSVLLSRSQKCGIVMGMNLRAIRHLLNLARKTDRWWLVPAVVFLCVIALVGVLALLAPVPTMIYPML